VSLKALSPYEKFTSVNGAKTHYYDTGKGYPLVLIHGGGAGTAAAVTWVYNLEELAKHFRVVAPDRLGYGLTNMPPGRDYSLATSSEHVISLLKQLKIRNAFILGWSQGGWVAAYIAIKQPKMVKKLVLVASGSVSIAYDYDVGERHATAKRYTRSEVDRWNESFTHRRDLVTEEMKELRLAYGERNFETDNRRAWTSPMTRLLDQSVDGKHMSDLISKITAPTLAIWGTLDKGFQKERGVRVLGSIKGSQLHIFNDANHEVMIDQYDGFNRVVRAFCEGSNPGDRLNQSLPMGRSAKSHA
jgi:2-hydroxymuconate-semialdehyde hydrolase